MASLLILNVNAIIFYEQKGSSLLLISFFTALTRCIELFLKPIIAFGSDNSSFKLGRRKPFMLFGCAFYCIFLVSIFTPPNSNISIYFGIFYNLFFIADTIASVPYFGLGPELSTSSIGIFPFFSTLSVAYILKQTLSFSRKSISSLVK